MKLATNTLIVLGLAIGLAGGVTYWELVGKPQRLQEETKKAKLFRFAESEVTEIAIIQPQQTLKFKRVNAGKWTMLAPKTQPANDAPIAFLLGQLTQGERVQDEPITIPPQDRAKFGLATPRARIEITLANGNRHRLILGNPDFTGTALYAEIDPDPTTRNAPVVVTLVPVDLKNAVQRELQEWQAPPAKASPSPQPKP
jgi:hypothetical protein